MWLAGKRARKEKDEMCIEKYWRLLGFALRTKKKLIQVLFEKIYLKLTLQHSEPLRFGSQFAMAIYGTKGLNSLDDENSARKVIQINVSMLEK